VSVNAPRGFTASGIACGIKHSGNLDLALVATESVQGVPAAAVFTSNRAAAAPVTVSRAHLVSTGGRAAAVVVSSGNANAATGARGVSDAERICELTARSLGVSPREVLICQTGLIGIQLPMERIESGIGALVSARDSGPQLAALAAEAIMTTDTVRKEVVVEGGGFTVGAMAKGAAMLAPNLATMLAVLTTDAECEAGELQVGLARAVETTFNQMTVDGCTSTNDSVVLLASGSSTVRPTPDELAAALERACSQLASMMVADAEGATKVVKVVVRGAASLVDARRAARKVAESMLVKCSLNGEDAYWGRVLSELGSSGAEFVMDRVSVSYGGIPVCRGGTAVPGHDVDEVRAHMSRSEVEITCDLGLGEFSAEVLSCDLGHGYIDENRTTS